MWSVDFGTGGRRFSSAHAVLSLSPIPLILMSKRRLRLVSSRKKMALL